MIERILEDENFAREIIDSGYQIVKRNTWKKVAQEYKKLYPYPF